MAGNYKIYRYRWVILAAIVPIIVTSETYWLMLSPIASLAQDFYRTGSMGISLFSLSYMLMYVVFTFPASWVVERYGFRRSLVIGALVTAAFGILRTGFAENFTVQLICQFFIAAGQPFLLNISTKAPANWFPVEERSAAAGILTLAQYLGFIVPMILSPLLAENYGIQVLLNVYAVIAAGCAVLAVALSKERPPEPPGPEVPKEDLSLRSMGRLFRSRGFLYVMVIVFIAMGIFNTLLTLIESILAPQGISMDEAGVVGAVFVLAGIAGAVVLPVLSDKIHRRVPLFVAAVSLLGPLYLGVAFLRSFGAVTLFAGLAGFTVMGVAPILFQHGAEVAYPADEGTSMGLILLMGQISGALFVPLFEWFGHITGSMAVPMVFAVVITALEIPVAMRMRESDFLKKSLGESAEQITDPSGSRP